MNFKILLISLISFGISPAYAADDASITERQEALEKFDNQPTSVISLAGVAVEKKDTARGDGGNAHLGFGFLYEANLNDHFGIETGLLYIKRQYEASFGDNQIITEVSRFHIPVSARFWINDYVSLAAGPYLGFNLGDVETTVIVGDQNINFDSNADDDLEFGFDLSGTLNLSISDKTGLFVEGRYSQPFDEDDSEDYQKLMGLAGVKLDI